RFLQNECNVHISRLEEVIQGITNIDELRLAAESITEVHKGAASVDYGERIGNWERNVEDLGRRFFYTNDMNRKMMNDISSKLFEHPALSPFRDQIMEGELFSLVKFVFLRVSDAPRLKDISKPTIVLVGGTSGTGKSTVSQHITRMLNFPIYASTDVISREVVRRIFSWTMGDDNARSIFPELFGSSFEGSDLSWYYKHSMLTMIGVAAVVDKLLENGTSAVIEGVPLVPGLLPESFFETANIVWMVTCIDDDQEHFQRYSGRDKAGVSRGGSERYRERFRTIRSIHDRLSEVARMGGAFRLNNGGDLKGTLELATDHVMGPFADKGLTVPDELRDSSFFDLAKRRYNARFEDKDRIQNEEFRRSHSRPEAGGPSLHSINEALGLWSSHARERIKKLEKELGKVDASEIPDPGIELRSRIEAARREIFIAEDLVETRGILTVLQNNFEFLRATRALLTQLRSVHVQLLTRLTSVPGTNYDDAKSIVHRFFKDGANMQDIDRARSAIKDLMAGELLYNIKCFLENEYNVEISRSDLEFASIEDLVALKDSLEDVVKRIFLTTADREISLLRISSMIDIWEKNLDAVIEKTFGIYLRWKGLEETEKDLIHGDPSISSIKSQVSRDELHRLIRWLTPRLYDVPKLKDLERRPTLVLINGARASGRSTILNHVSTMLSIPICFTSDIVESVVVRTFEWLLGAEETRISFPSLYPGSDDGQPLEAFYARTVLTMMGMRGALDRLIKENTSAVIVGDTLVSSMLEERYFESSNVIGIVTKIRNGGGHVDLINDRLSHLARMGHTLIVDDPTKASSLEIVRTRVTSPYADRGLPVDDDLRDTHVVEIEAARRKIVDEYGRRPNGAVLTDIDDTIIPSGIRPDEEWIVSFSSFVRTLAKSNILWAPMSGVAQDKLGERLLFRLPEDVCTNIIAYLGDGSSKYLFDDIKRVWIKDPDYSRELTDAQSVAIIGSTRYHQFLVSTASCDSDRTMYAERVSEALAKVHEHNEGLGPGVVPIDPLRGIVGELEDRLRGSGLVEELKDKGYEVKDPQTYFRGGSVSWMMLGDISAHPYEEEKALEIRMDRLIPFAERRLMEHNHLKDLGTDPVNVPFPGARGIKFVLSGNDKERGARDLIGSYTLPKKSVIFIGNELFQGGNDNMLRNIEGINLLSVGARTDPGIIDWGEGVEGNWTLMEVIKEGIEKGRSLEEIMGSISQCR
ncbi:MAG: hypothetical protein ACMUHM_09640, partial [Thermoplasmatota archaeon]